MFNVSIPTKQFIAISQFTAKQDVRFYLNGMAINQGHLVATNGHYLAAIPVEDSAEVDIIIPEIAISMLVKALSAKQKRLHVVTVAYDDNEYRLICHGVVVPFIPVNGNYPQWELVTPDEYEPTVHECYDWNQVALFSKAASILNAGHYSNVFLFPNGNRAAKVTIPKEPNFIGVIMPKRA